MNRGINYQLINYRSVTDFPDTCPTSLGLPPPIAGFSSIAEPSSLVSANFFVVSKPWFVSPSLINFVASRRLTSGDAFDPSGDLSILVCSLRDIIAALLKATAG
jgi:hypothetical protein